MIEIVSGTFYSTGELAKMLHVKPDTIKSWRARKKYALPFYKIGGAIKYLGKDVSKWIEANMN